MMRANEVVISRAIVTMEDNVNRITGFVPLNGGCLSDSVQLIIR